MTSGRDRFVVGPDDPEADDVRALLNAHLTFARTHTRPDEVRALDIEARPAEDLLFFSVREDGALRQLDATHVELKSMHTAEAARGRGVGRALVEHLVAVARTCGCTRVSLETGTMVAFAPSRALYASAGFEVCAPFGDHPPSPNSVGMTLALVGSGHQP